jgi:hypothetical protein
MFTRTATTKDVPEREIVDEQQMCPPHSFDQGWGINTDDDVHADTVPVLFCAACGEVRLLRVPSDAA